MKAAIVATFNKQNVTDQLEIFVNAENRKLTFYNTTNLYQSYAVVGDVIQVKITFAEDQYGYLGITRRDFTTDDTEGNMGVINNFIVPTLIAWEPTYVIYEFTASTVANAYDFQYFLDTYTGPPEPVALCIWNTNNRTWDMAEIYWGTCTNVPVLTKAGAFGANQKTACKATNQILVYFSGTTFGLGTPIFSDPALTIPVPNGWFSDFTTLYRVLGGVLFSTEACPPCLEDPKTVNWRMDYSYTSDNVTGFTLSELSLRTWPIDGSCVGGYGTPVNNFTPGSWINYSGLTGATSWSGSTNLDGQTVGVRNLIVQMNGCYQKKDYPSIKRSIDLTNFKLYINNVFIRNAVALSPQYGAYGSYSGNMIQCSGMTIYTNFYIDFGNLTINENDNVRIEITDQFYTPWNKNEFEYNWTNSRTNSRIISGYTFGGGFYIPNYVKTVTGTTGTYSTGQYTSQLPLGVAQLFFSIANDGVTDTILTRTIKLFQNGIEQTGYTVTQTGATVPVFPSRLLRFYTNWPPSVGSSQITNKWQITDDFTQPTPTPTPTITPTPTPTPTPVPATIAYQYIGTSTNAGTTKTASNLRINSGSGGTLLMTRANATFTTSTNTTTGTTIIDNSFVGTPLNLQVVRTITKTGSSSEFITTRTFQIYRNGVLEISFNSTTDFTVPLSPNNLPQDYVFPTAITINPGDAIVVRWNDTII